MRKYVNRICLAIVLIILIGMTVQAQPQMKIIPSTVIDWGTVKDNDTVLSRTLIVKNTGSDTLRIKNIEPGCGCTTVPMKKRIIAPNDTAHMTVMLRTQGTKEYFDKFVVLTTNEIGNNVTSLNLKAIIIQRLVFTPGKFFSFGEIIKNETGSADITITNNTDEDIEFREIVTEPKDLIKLNIKNNDIIPKNGNVVLHLEIDTHNLPVGFFDSSIKFKTTDEKTHKVEILGRGQVLNPKED